MLFQPNIYWNYLCLQMMCRYRDGYLNPGLAPDGELLCAGSQSPDWELSPVGYAPRTFSDLIHRQNLKMVRGAYPTKNCRTITPIV